MTWDTKIFEATGQSESITLSTGTYKFECWGAQGGSGLNNAKALTEGGKGSYASGVLQINGTQTFYIYVGTKGGNGSATKNTVALGGWNGGGNSGADTNDDDCSGGGGGATDIRLVDGSWNSQNSLVSRIIVAAGGSGSAYNTNGAPGGMLTGYIATSVTTYVDGSPTTSYKDASEYFNLGVGDDGINDISVPSSGAGGGYFGGKKSTPHSSLFYKCVSSSGTSYVSGFPGCKSVDENGAKTENSIHYSNIEFLFPSIQDGLSRFLNAHGTLETGHEGNGTIKITRIDGFSYSNKRSCINKAVAVTLRHARCTHFFNSLMLTILVI